MFGSYEKYVSNLYRSLFIDLRSAVTEIKTVANPTAILEIGCGEGALTELLAQSYPNASILATDITPQVGRLFEGDRTKVTFVQNEAENFEVPNNGTFDLVVICDVIHHVPEGLRRQMITFAKSKLKPDGLLAVKEWERRPTLIHALCYLIERYITGDKVAYLTRDEIKNLIGKVFEPVNIEREARIPPWKNNLLLLVRN
jgi:2-polyprenyl-3-methyl-5-hydroxy-6-metoxy-1,4-benzoquinol methylase